MPLCAPPLPNHRVLGHSLTECPPMAFATSRTGHVMSPSLAAPSFTVNLFTVKLISFAGYPPSPEDHS